MILTVIDIWFRTLISVVVLYVIGVNTDPSIFQQSILGVGSIVWVIIPAIEYLKRRKDKK